MPDAAVVPFPRESARTRAQSPAPTRAWRELLAEAERSRRGGRHHEALQLSDRAAQQGEEARYHAALLRGHTLMDLGDAAGALSSYDSVADPRVPDYDLDAARGIALFELARLPEAENALRSALRGRPDRADVYYTLGLIAEIHGSGEEAELFRKARRLAPEQYPARPQLSRTVFETLVDEALACLPASARGVLEEVPVLVADVPYPEDLRGTDPPTSPRRLAMSVGGSGTGELPAILVFQRNVERAVERVADPAAVVEAVRRAVHEEVGRARGLAKL